MAQIGEPQREIHIEPLTIPVPQRAPVSTPAPTPLPEKVPVPA